MMTELEYKVTQIKIEQENEEKLKHYPILQKQLDIAVKALDSLRGICFPERAEKALKEIEALNEIHKQE